jgi:hypothetical protein
VNKYIIALVILPYLIIGCGKKGSEQGSPIAEKVAAFQNIETIRTGDKLDFRAIEEIYNLRLKEFALKYDKTFGEEMGVIIEKAIRNGKASKYPKAQVQIISKTLQKVFFLALKGELEQAAKLDNASARHLEDASGYYEVIRPTVLRRGEWMKVGTLYDEEIQQVFSKAREAIEKKDSAQFESQRNMLNDKLIRIFALSVLFEVEGLIENRAIYEQAQIKQAEASTYYSIIEKEIKKNNPGGHEIIHYQLNVNPEDADFDVIKKELEVGLPNLKIE